MVCLGIIFGNIVLISPPSMYVFNGVDNVVTGYVSRKKMVSAYNFTEKIAVPIFNFSMV